MVRRSGFGDGQERLREVSATGDELERIAALVDFAVPAFADKNHLATDRRHGPIRGWTARHRSVSLGVAWPGAAWSRAATARSRRVGRWRWSCAASASPTRA